MRDKKLIEAMAMQPWAMHPNHLGMMANVILKHACGDVLAEDELAVIIAGARKTEPDGEVKEADAAGRAFGEFIRSEATAIIPVHGVLARSASQVNGISGPSGTSQDELRMMIIEARRDDSVSNVVLDFHSPGGSAFGVSETAKLLRMLADEKPTVAFAGDLSASAAYWLMAQAGQIVVGDTAYIGSIGVYTVITDFSARFETEGLKANLVKAGDKKGIGEMGTEVTEEQLATIQKDIDAIYDIFVGAVASGRNLTTAQALALATGETWTGLAAVKVGLADVVGSFEDALRMAREEETAAAVAAGIDRQVKTVIGIGRPKEAAAEAMTGFTAGFVQVDAARAAAKGSTTGGESENVKWGNWTAGSEAEAALETIMKNAGADAPATLAPDSGELNRSGQVMAKTTAGSDPAAPTKEPEVSVDTKALEEAKAAARAEEAQRSRAIHAMGSKFDLEPVFVEAAIASSKSEAEVQTDVMEILAKRRDGVSINVGEDVGLARLSQDFEDAICLKVQTTFKDGDEIKGQLVTDPSRQAQALRNLPLSEIARKFMVKVCGVAEAETMPQQQLGRIVFNRTELARFAGPSAAVFGHTASDFPLILENVVTKTLRQAFREYPSTWEFWVRRREVADFREVKTNRLSEVPTPPLVLEGGDYEDFSLTESQEKYAVAKYGQTFSATWEMMINDDADMLGRLPAAMGASAKRKENDVVYAILTSNPNMSDGNPLFDAAHNNEETTGAQLSTTTLGIIEAAITAQTGVDGTTTIDLVPAILLTTPKNNYLARQVLQSVADPSAAHAGVMNPAQGALIPVIEPRLSSLGTGYDYFVVVDARGGQPADTIEIAFLEGQPEPFLETQDGFETDGRRWKMRHVFGAKAIDWRGMFHHAGVA